MSARVSGWGRGTERKVSLRLALRVKVLTTTMPSNLHVSVCVWSVSVYQVTCLLVYLNKLQRDYRRVPFPRERERERNRHRHRKRDRDRDRDSDGERVDPLLQMYWRKVFAYSPLVSVFFFKKIAFKALIKACQAACVYVYIYMEEE